MAIGRSALSNRRGADEVSVERSLVVGGGGWGIHCGGRGRRRCRMLFLLGVEHLHEQCLRGGAAAHMLVEEVLLSA